MCKVCICFLLRSQTRLFGRKGGLWEERCPVHFATFANLQQQENPRCASSASFSRSLAMNIRDEKVLSYRKSEQHEVSPLSQTNERTNKMTASLAPAFSSHGNGTFTANRVPLWRMLHRGGIVTAHYYLIMNEWINYIISNLHLLTDSFFGVGPPRNGLQGGRRSQSRKKPRWKVFYLARTAASVVARAFRVSFTFRTSAFCPRRRPG